MMLVVISLRYFLKGKLSLRLRYALWLPVLIRLLMPINLIDSPVSVMNAFEHSQAYKTTEQTLLKIRVYSDMIRYGEITPDENTDAGSGTPHETWSYPPQSLNEDRRTYNQGALLSRILNIVWLIGFAVVGLTLLFCNLGFIGKLKKNREKYDTINCRLPVYLLDDIQAPFLFGLLRPSIYITRESAGDKAKLPHVLEHELTHYRHGDHIWSALRGSVLAAYWYNPLVWLSAALSRRDSELACDEGTIKRIGEENRMEYGRTLIGLTCGNRKAKDLLCCATTMKDGKKGIKERIMLISKKPKTLLPALIAVLLVIAAAVGCTFTGANNNSKESDPGSGIVPLTQEEIDKLNKAFEPFLINDNGKIIGVNPVSHFFKCYYDRPEDINLAEFLCYFPSETITDEAELDVLKSDRRFPFSAEASLDQMLPIHKITAESVNEILLKYTGITLKDLSGVGAEDVIYLEEYDAYYNFTSDFAAGTFSCTHGEREGDTVRLFYYDQVILTLKKKEDSYLIVSYQRVGDSAGIKADKDERVASADINNNGQDETFYIDKSRANMDGADFVTSPNL